MPRTTTPRTARKSARFFRIAVIIGEPPSPSGRSSSRLTPLVGSALLRRQRQHVVDEVLAASIASCGFGTGAGGLISAPGVSWRIGNAGIGPPGACRFGSSCSSHGTSGRCGSACCRRRAAGRDARGRRAERRRRGSTGCCRRRGGSRRRGPGCRAELVADLLVEFSASLPVSGFGILEVHERHEHVVRAGRERASRARNGTEVWLKATTSGIVWRRTRAVPRSSSSDIRRRACVMKGSERVDARRTSARPAARRARRRAGAAAPRSASRARAARSGACRAAPGSRRRAPRPRGRERRRSR